MPRLGAVRGRLFASGAPARPAAEDSGTLRYPSCCHPTHQNRLDIRRGESQADDYSETVPVGAATPGLSANWIVAPKSSCRKTPTTMEGLTTGADPRARTASSKDRRPGIQCPRGSATNTSAP